MENLSSWRIMSEVVSQGMEGGEWWGGVGKRWRVGFGGLSNNIE